MDKYSAGPVPTDRPEAVVELRGVQQGPGPPGLLQDGDHDLVPQSRVEPDYLLDVTEQLVGLHLRQQAALLQVQQPTQEQLQNHTTVHILKLLSLNYFFSHSKANVYDSRQQLSLFLHQ